MMLPGNYDSVKIQIENRLHEAEHQRLVRAVSRAQPRVSHQRQWRTWLGERLVRWGHRLQTGAPA
jgi:hypothetical protein